MIQQRIPEFYAGLNILITGANGFMGKVLVEKLLRSCPDLNKIYVIMRGRRNKTASERWRDVTQSMCFDRLKCERPGALENKIEVVEGDMKELRLGLSDDSYGMLRDNVHIIFHAAATVKFNDPLTDAVLTNLRGTHELVKLALEMKHLKVFVHISTTFCNCYQTESEEVIYPAPADWKKTIAVAENLDRTAVSILSQKYLGVFPNTYTFTKNLAECLIKDYEDRIPFVLVRPSIVIASVKEPIPGWIDNANGPIGLLIAASKGIIRMGFTDKDAQPDYMAPDVSAKAMIVAVWKKALCPEDHQVSVYNMACTTKGVTNGELINLGLLVVRETPPSGMLWVPCTRTTKNYLWYKINAIFLHLIPALIVDSILKLLGREPQLYAVQKKIHIAAMALGYFTTKPWVFKNENFLSLNKEILPADIEDFDHDFQDVDPLTYFKHAIKIGKITILNENEEETLPQARIVERRLYWADKILFNARKVFLVWLVAHYILHYVGY